MHELQVRGSFWVKPCGTEEAWAGKRGLERGLTKGKDGLTESGSTAGCPNEPEIHRDLEVIL